MCGSKRGERSRTLSVSAARLPTGRQQISIAIPHPGLVGCPRLGLVLPGLLLLPPLGVAVRTSRRNQRRICLWPTQLPINPSVCVCIFGHVSVQKITMKYSKMKLEKTKKRMNRNTPFDMSCNDFKMCWERENAR